MTNARSRNYAVTDNTNDTAFWNTVDCKYIVVGKEIAPTTLHPHLQITIVFKEAKTVTAARALFPVGHWEIARSVHASIKYCKKEGDFTERGSPPAQGKRTDFDDVYDAITQDQATYNDILELNPRIAIQFTQGVKAAINSQVKHRSQDVAPEVHWFYGPTASGKSREAFAQAGENAYVVPTTGRFWDGYAGEECVIFDDFRSTQIDFALFLKILDRYRMSVEVKGSSVKLAATKFWITTPDDPTATYTRVNHATNQMYINENINQLVRRCTEIRRFGPLPLAPIFNNDQV